MSNHPLKLFLIAGEPSGDALGSRLMAALNRATGGDVRFAGVGGPKMLAQGLHSIFDYRDLAVMGLAEVVPQAPKLLRRIRQAAAAIEREDPDAIVTIDSPSFAFSVFRRLKGHTQPRIHYVAPQIWAWRPRRVDKFKKYADHILALFPFEPPYFAAASMPCTFVGHPVLEAVAAPAEGRSFRRRHGIDDRALVLCALPGSRRAEVRRLRSVYVDAITRLAARHANLHVVLPTVSTVMGDIRSLADDLPAPHTIVADSPEKPAALAASDLAIAASGTATLELACAQVPTVVVYKLAAPTAWVGRWFIRVRYASIVNILAGREIFPEFLQANCKAKSIVAVLDEWLENDAGRRQIIDAEAAVVDALKSDGPAPSERAAETIIQIVRDFPGADAPVEDDRPDQMREVAAMATTTESRRDATGDTGNFRLLHTMIRVKDLERSIDFYTRLLGMGELRRKDYEGGRFTNAFVGYGDEDRATVLELTHNWDQAEPYTHGSGFGHLAIGVPDIYATCDALAREGVNIARPPGPMKHGSTVIAFIEDPDGYKIELIERG